METLRIHYTREGRMKFLSHLEMVRLVERAFRRADVPMKFSEGFNPHPKYAFAAPLSVGVSSDAGYIDVELTEKIDIDDLLRRQRTYLPEGLTFKRAKYVTGASAMMSQVVAAEFLIEFNLSEEADVDRYVEQLLALEEIPFEKKKKRGRKVKVRKVNLRPLIRKVQRVLKEDNRVILRVLLDAGQTGGIKPSLLMEKWQAHTGVPADLDTVRVHRLALYGDHNGALKDIYDMK